jgi:hypothetical protein
VPLISSFKVDPATSNKLTDNFYHYYNEANYAKTAGDATAALQYRYLNKIRLEVSELYNEISTIQNSDASDAEKLAGVRTVRVLINELQKTAIDTLPTLTAAIEYTTGIESSAVFGQLIAASSNPESTTADYRYLEATRLMYGSAAALEQYNADVYAKASLLERAGITYDDYYAFYFTQRTLTSDKDKLGNTISGSLKKKVIGVINSIPALSTEQKLYMIMAQGYAIADGDIRGVTAARAKGSVARWINNIGGLTAEQKQELAEAAGYTVKNGRIIISSGSSTGIFGTSIFGTK